jgi:hypothetical protein
MKSNDFNPNKLRGSYYAQSKSANSTDCSFQQRLQHPNYACESGIKTGQLISANVEGATTLSRHNFRGECEDE